MSDKMDDLKNDATQKADDVRDEGEQANRDTDESIDRLKGTTGEHRDRGGNALAGAKGWFDKIKKSVTGNR